MASFTKKHVGRALAFGLGGSLVVSALLVGNSAYATTASGYMTGFAFGGTPGSDGAYQGIGWISLNGASDASSVPYAVTIPSTNDNLSGYAWSENYGWLSFNASDLSGCPSGTCAAYRNGQSINGWARFINVPAEGADNSGGFDGWVSLSGSGYGVTLSNNALSGYAWSSDLGWISFSGASVTSNDPTVTITPSPDTINPGGGVTLTWTSTNATSCTSAGGFSTGGATSGSVVVYPLTTTNYQITCSSSDGTNTVTSPPSTATVTVVSPDVSIIASPTRVRTGESSSISWSASHVQSCTISGPGISRSDFSSSTTTQAVRISTQSTYTITCQTGSTPVSRSVNVNIVPNFKEF